MAAPFLHSHNPGMLCCPAASPYELLRGMQSLSMDKTVHAFAFLIPVPDGSQANACVFMGMW